MLRLALNDESVGVDEFNVDVFLLDARKFTLQFVCGAGFTDVEARREGSSVPWAAGDETLGWEEGVEFAKEGSEGLGGEVREERAHGSCGLRRGDGGERSAGARDGSNMVGLHLVLRCGEVICDSSE